MCVWRVLTSCVGPVSGSPETMTMNQAVIHLTMELKPSQRASISFERRFGVLGFEIETHDNEDAFWVPIVLRTRSRLKTSWS